MCSYNESYEVEADLIGKGAFGEVRKAKSKKDQNLKICVKILEKEPNFGKHEANELQEKELKMCKDMINKKYENLVQIYDVYDSDVEDKAYIFMERCDLNLHQLMDQKKKKKENFSKEKLLDIIKQIVNGYNFLIHENIIHRDLKPENILCNINNDNELTIKIADFGISKILTSQSNQQMTKKVGTPYYRAPEIKDDQPNFYDNKCDIFSLGVIIFELAILEKQFKSNNKDKELLQKQTFSQLHNDVFTQKKIHLDEEILKLLDQTIVYDPNKRMTWEKLLEFFQIKPHQHVQNAPNIKTQRQQTIQTFGQISFTPTPTQNQNQKQQPLTFPLTKQQQHIQNVAQNYEQIKPQGNQQNTFFKKQNSLDPDNYPLQPSQQEKIRFATTKNQQTQFINMQQQQFIQNPKLNNGWQPVNQEQGPYLGVNGQQIQYGLQQGVNAQQIQQGFKGEFPQSTIQKPIFQMQVQSAQFGSQAKEVQLGEQKYEVKQQPIQSLQSNNKTNQFQIPTGFPQFQNQNAQMGKFGFAKPI